MNHTEEPWELEKGKPWAIRPARPSFDWIASVQVSNTPNWEENARRIVACVNACAGIPTEQMEIEPYIGSISYNMRMQAEKQRDELAVSVRRLHILLARYRDEVPLGHQPHMIAHLVDAELGRV